MTKSLIKNFVSLSFIQVVNFIVPLATVPYIVRMVGIENYGSVGIAVSLATFFVVFSDYGFNLSATREISLNRNDRKQLSLITSKVMVCKSIILLLSCTIYFLLIATIPYFSKELKLFSLSSLIIVGTTSFPTWFFQGIEKMSFITYLTVANRLFMAAMTFIFIKEGNHYVYVNFISGVSSLIAAVIATVLVFKRNGLLFRMPTSHIIIKELKDGFLIFISNLSNVVYSFSNNIILDLVTGDRVIVGCYTIAEKILIMVKQVLIIYSQVIYPHLCILSKEGYGRVVLFFKKNFIPFFGLIVVGSCAMFFLAPWIILFLTGEFVHESVLALRIMSCLPIIISLNIPSYQTLLIYNQKRLYSSIYFSAALISVFSNWMLCYKWSYVGTIISIILTESFITVGLYLLSTRIAKAYA